MRILFVRIGCTNSSQCNSSLFTFVVNGFCTAFHGIKGDEISAQRFGPGSDTQSAQFAFQSLQYQLKFRTHDICMFSHLLFNTVQVLEVTYMTKLVDLIMADDLNGHRFLHPVKICLGGCQTADTCTCKADLGSRSKFQNHILFTVCLAHTKDLRQSVLFVLIKMMYAICIIPVYSEILCCRT